MTLFARRAHDGCQAFQRLESQFIPSFLTTRRAHDTMHREIRPPSGRQENNWGLFQGLKPQATIVRSTGDLR